ncbi:unnamed protein product [Sphagnum tenellum]
MVQETLASSVGSTSLSGTSGNYWPLDTSFALSLGATSTFTVGVQANTNLSGSDASSGSSQCYPTAGGAAPTAAANSIVSSCLGFAAPAASNGTCPTIQSASGQTQPTYRLRRYVALYPLLFDTNGSAITSTPQYTDTIYVLDRPVQASSTINPLQPYTMLGPKPCPFAFFDSQNVTEAFIPTTADYPLGYRATNDNRWKTGDGTINWTQSWTKGVGPTAIFDNNGGTNIDGIEFPNFDSSQSCSAIIPFLSADSSKIYFSTVNKYRNSVAASTLSGLTSVAKYNHLFIRPYKPFAPHYEEDTNFIACAPSSNPRIIDPPLHLMPAGNGRYSWCAESYPTQNTNIAQLDPPTPAPAATPAIIPTIPSGLVAPYTSHLSTLNGSAPPATILTPCAATLIPSPAPTSYTYPIATAHSGYAVHSATTVLTASTSVAYLTSGSTTYSAVTPASGTANQTCDRTVTPPPTNSSVTWAKFPLLAPAADVENALQSDSSYNCSITFDNSAGKAATSPPQTPSGGCCLLQSVSTPSAKTNAKSLGTHVEPSQGICLPPAY